MVIRGTHIVYTRTDSFTLSGRFVFATLRPVLSMKMRVTFKTLTEYYKIT